MKNFILGLFGLLCLASCAPDPQAVAMQHYQAMTTSCAAQYPDQPPTMAAYQKCKNAAADTTVARYTTYPDLYQLAHAGRVEIADQADKGQITLDQANTKIAQFNEQIIQINLYRNQQNAEAAAENLSALSNFLASERALQPPIQPYYAPLQQTVITSCTNIGNQTNCTSQ